jgi:inorganic pyrophosphatase
MNIDLIPAGDDPPHSINVLIEVPIGGDPVKYEFDKKSGALFVDRILHTSMRYPANYGFIPQTLCGDGDPLDCLVMARWPLMTGSVIRARPVGVLFLEDEAGGDEKPPCPAWSPSPATAGEDVSGVGGSAEAGTACGSSGSPSCPAGRAGPAGS